jgi:alkanesulfonate monooxygenase SsuD/methylene tetrahydromethanopterin reductase-like flavin-dependent oxidoreductase (luciferase family)
MEIGRLGVWTWLGASSADEAAAFAQRIEALGYSTLWLPEAVGRDPFTLRGFLAARTERIVLATGMPTSTPGIP